MYSFANLFCDTFRIVIFLSNFAEKPLQKVLIYVKLKEVENDKKITI